MKFNSMNTNDNPADLITRGVSLDKFKAQFLFLLPGWLVKPYNGRPVSWDV